VALGGDLGEAYHHCRALALARDNGLPFAETEALLGLAAVEQRTGRHRDAVEHAGRALGLARRGPYRILEDRALATLATARLALGS
jgi:hypothetical protein